MSVYSALLGRAYETSAGAVNIFTAPAGQVTVVRDIVMWNGSGGSTSLTLTVYTSGLALAAILLEVPTVPAGTSEHIELRQVLNVGDILTATGGAAPWSVAVSGYALS